MGHGGTHSKTFVGLARISGVLSSVCVVIACSSPSADETKPPPNSEPKRPNVDLSQYDRSCKANQDCELVFTICCPNYASELKDVAALRQQEVWFYDYAAGEACASTLCELVNRRNSALIAACIDGLCTAIDISKDESFRHCTNDADCTVRPRDCCACGKLGSGLLIAVSDEARYEALACGAGCDDCGARGPPTIEEGTGGVCSNGLCTVVYPP
jgi:hypothetical protein